MNYGECWVAVRFRNGLSLFSNLFFKRKDVTGCAKCLCRFHLINCLTWIICGELINIISIWMMRFVSWIVLMWIDLFLGNFACENCEIKRMSVIKRNYIHNTAKDDRYMCVVFDFLPHTWTHTHCCHQYDHTLHRGRYNINGSMLSFTFNCLVFGML